jgi:NitT/TauT family transport system ATP-binding protein
MVAGLTPYSSGTITIGDKLVDRPQTDVGIVFQDAIMLDWRNVLSNVMLQIDIRHMDRVKYETFAMNLLNATGLGGFEKKNGHTSCPAACASASPFAVRSFTIPACC